MTDLPRTIAEIWSGHERTARWHTLWIEHLRLQGADPAVVADYERIATAYRDAGSPNALDVNAANAMQTARHEVVAVLEASNHAAGADVAHLGLASSDIVDPTTQVQTMDSLALVVDHALHVADRLRRLMVQHAECKLVARTHGQPAQLTTYGHRQATILAPLLDWCDRAAEMLVSYPLRPPTGAVGTAADLVRVLGARQGDGRASTTAFPSTRSALDGVAGTEPPPDDVLSDSTAGERVFNPRPWAGPIMPDHQAFETPEQSAALVDANLLRRGTAGLGEATDAGNVPPDEVWRAEVNGGEVGPFERYASQLAARLGFGATMDASRQVYHRSYDLRVASLLSELASIGQTWATDRRLESMLGLGNESHEVKQSGSSSMPQKLNPRFSERICGLAVVTRCYSNACAELAGMEWLEGDVSTSAARKLILPAMFQNIDDILSNWAHVAAIWQVDEQAIECEVHIYRHEWATPAIMQLLVDRGISRSEAHRCLREAWMARGSGRGRVPDPADDFEWLVEVLRDRGIPTTIDWPTNRFQLQGVITALMAEPVGNVAGQIDWLDRRAAVALQACRDGDWEPQVNP